MSDARAAAGDGAAAAAAYDEVAYPGYAYPQTRPDRLASVAWLFGVPTAPVDACRVLELGCGDGANVLAGAAALPGSTFVGIDAAARPVERARALAEAAGLANARFEHVGVEEAGDELGEFDYVVSHGVYSWIPPGPRDALLRACAERLAPGGVAYVSYNAYPGSYLRDMAREVLEYHLRGIEGAGERLVAARELMELIVAAGNESPYAGPLQEQMQRMLDHTPWLLHHDDLARVNTPVYFHEFVEHAARHGLAFLAEADLFESQLSSLPPQVATALDGLTADVVEREQYFDFVKNRPFRQTLLCHATTPVDRRLDPRRLSALAFSAKAFPVEDDEEAEPGTWRFAAAGSSVRTAHPLLAATLSELASSSPAALGFETLRRRLSTRPNGDTPLAEELQTVLLRAVLAGVVETWRRPPSVDARAGDRPRASPLARAQAAGGSEIVTTLTHASVHLADPEICALLVRLDGTRDREQLVAELAAEVPDGDGQAPAELVGEALERLAGAALLAA